MASLQSQQNYLKFSSSRTSTNLPVFPIAVEVLDDVNIDEASPSSFFQTSTSEICKVESDPEGKLQLICTINREHFMRQSNNNVFCCLEEVPCKKRDRQWRKGKQRLAPGKWQHGKIFYSFCAFSFAHNGSSPE